MRAVLATIVLVGAACGSSPASPGAITIHQPPELAFGTNLAAQDLARDLSIITNAPLLTADLPARCVGGEVHLAVLGHEHDASGAKVGSDLGPQQYELEETRCGQDGHLVVIRGGSHLAAQWAIYDLLERLGVRYFHPEHTLYPTALTWPAEPIEVRESPAFSRRSLHAHRTHPIELSAPLVPFTNMAGYQRNWIVWNLKLRHTEVDGWDEALVGTYAWDRGFPRSAGLNLLNAQQGGRPVIDADDPRPESEQIAEAIDAQMAPRDDAPDVSSFGFQFNPSEFTTADEELTVQRLTFITEYIGERWPEVEVRTINHGTGQPVGPVYGVRFFDLSQFAPPALGVQLHTLMFYDLDRPAPVYGNQDFGFLRDFIVSQHQQRRLHYYPESSWWLTFDLPVPLYLAPVSLEARDRDLALLRPYLNSEPGASTGVVGHHTFSSGQEWGYWMIDYCTARMTWDLELGWAGCLEHVTSAFAAGDTIRGLLLEVGAAQAGPLRDPAILAMLVGSDDETEAAELAGIEFHPLPPPPAEVLTWSDDRAAALQTASVDPLPAMAAQYAAWADTVAATAPLQSTEQLRFVAEIVDGLRITGLRAQHSHQLYSAVLGLRAAIRASDFAAIDDAAAWADQALATTDAAREVVRAREQNYRYPPRLTIEGDEPESPDAVPNKTIYPYRYLSRTHRMFYWTRPDDQLDAMFGFDLVTVNDRILRADTALAVDLLANQVSELAIDWGDGAISTALEPHLYAAQGFYSWTLDALHQLGALHHEDAVAIVNRKFVFAKGSLTVSEPSGAALIEGLLPGFVIGLGDDADGAFLALGRVDGDPAFVAHGTLQRRVRVGLATVAGDLTLELKNVGVITVYDGIITIGEGGGASTRELAVTGELSTDEVIDLVVATGGFDQPGAREIVAGTLGYTAETLPARLPMILRASGSEP